MHRNPRLIPSLLTLALVLVCACDGEDASDTQAGDTTGDGDGDGSADLCDPSQANSGVVVGETQLDTAYPEAAGGALADGTYDMSQFWVYSPGTADDNLREERIIVADGTLTSIRSNNGGPAEIIGAAYTVDGTNLVFSVECPSSASVEIPFTVTDTELWLFDPSEPNIKVYVKQ